MCATVLLASSAAKINLLKLCKKRTICGTHDARYHIIRVPSPTNLLIETYCHRLLIGVMLSFFGAIMYQNLCYYLC